MCDKRYYHILMRPIYSPYPNPAGNPTNQNHKDVKPTLKKTSPHISINKVLVTYTIYAIL